MINHGQSRRHSSHKQPVNRNNMKQVLWDFYLATIVLRKALLLAVPCALIAVALKLGSSEAQTCFKTEFFLSIARLKVLENAAAYSGFSLVLGFLVVFRTQLAYSRFWEGVSAAHRMCAEWFDGASSVLAYVRVSKADAAKKNEFNRTFLKLMTLLHGVAVASLRDLDDLSLTDADLEGLDRESIQLLQNSPYPVTVISQWLLDLIMSGLEEKIINVPPPIVSRALNEMANGMVAYHDCMKIQTTNVPLPYKQMTMILMVAHFFVTPVVMCMWTAWVTWTFIFTLIQSMIFWCLYFTAHQIEFPFQVNSISYSVAELHHEFATNLLTMVCAKKGKLQGSFNPDPLTWIHHMDRLDQLSGQGEREKTMAMRRQMAKPYSDNFQQVTGILPGQMPDLESGTQGRDKEPALNATETLQVRTEGQHGSAKPSSQPDPDSGANVEGLRPSTGECKTTTPAGKTQDESGLEGMSRKNDNAIDDSSQDRTHSEEKTVGSRAAADQPKPSNFNSTTESSRSIPQEIAIEQFDGPASYCFPESARRLCN